MKQRTALLIAAASVGPFVAAACSGPVALSRAIQPQHDREYREMLAADPASPKHSWYVYKAQEEGITVDEARARDQALSTTRNPFKASRDPAAVSRGAVIFRALCQRCHGADARGDGGDLIAERHPVDHHAFGQRFAATIHGGAPRAWFRKINEGAGDVVAYPDGPTTAMPPFGDTLAREQIWLVVTYLQSLDLHQPRTAESRGS